MTISSSLYTYVKSNQNNILQINQSWFNEILLVSTRRSSRTSPWKVPVAWWISLVDCTSSKASKAWRVTFSQAPFLLPASGSWLRIFMDTNKRNVISCFDMEIFGKRRAQEGPEPDNEIVNLQTIFDAHTALRFDLDNAPLCTWQWGPSCMARLVPFFLWITVQRLGRRSESAKPLGLCQDPKLEASSCYGTVTVTDPRATRTPFQVGVVAWVLAVTSLTWPAEK